jgi:hypothetical protein
VVDREQSRAFVDDALAAGARAGVIGWAWELLNLRQWARAHR